MKEKRSVVCSWNQKLVGRGYYPEQPSLSRSSKRVDWYRRTREWSGRKGSEATAAAAGYAAEYVPPLLASVDARAWVHH